MDTHPNRSDEPEDPRCKGDSTPPDRRGEPAGVDARAAAFDPDAAGAPLDADPSESRMIVDKSVKNIFWSYVAFFSTKALNLIAIFIVARFVTPAEFGLVAFGLVIIGYFELMQGFGLGAYLISTRHDIQESAEAVFVFSIGASATLLGLLWLGSGEIAAFFDQPGLEEVLVFLGVGVLIEAIATVHYSLLQRELKFRLKVLPDVGRGLAKGGVSIILAILGFGVWALVYGYVAGMVVWATMLFIVQPWRPRGLPRLAVLRTALGFGSNMVLGSICRAVPRTLDSLLIGKMLGTGPLGLYTVALRMPQLALKTFGMEASKVIHPVMSQIQTDSAALRRYYYGLARYFALLMFPAGVALASMTSPLIRVIYTPKWYGMIDAMELLCIGFALNTINQLPGTLYKALNRSDYFMVTAVITLPFVVAVLWFATPHGIEAVAIAQISLVFITYVPNFMLLRRMIGVTIPETAKALWPGIVCAVATGTGALLVKHFISGPPLLQLAATGCAALLVFVVALRLLAPEILHEVRALVERKLRKRRRARRRHADASSDTGGAV